MLIVKTFIKQFELFNKCNTISVGKRFVAHNKWLKRKMNSEKLPPHRSNPIIKTLDTPEFRSIFNQELNDLVALFKKYNYEIRIAGGAVRDIVSGMNPKDLDFATTATPDQMKEMFTKEEIRMINTNGERHGTVTSRINDKENFEVTTLRIDVATDGRHADVEFTTDWLLDSSRRDLTINSMFLDFDGNIYDYFYGYDDLLKKRVAFVGEPAQRITEDYLRIFRYFRFYGRISETPDNHDEPTIQAIKDNIDGLERISGERIWSEWSKILSGNFHKELTRKIIECGCGKYMGLPQKLNLQHFDEVCERAQENNIKLKPASLVAALLHTQEEVMDAFARLKFTNYDRNLAVFIVSNRDIVLNKNPLKPYQSLVLKTIGKTSDAREYCCELLKYKGSLDLLQEFEKWNVQFPINGKMVMPYVNQNHKIIGDIIQSLKDVWLDSDCKMPAEELKTYIPNIATKALSEWEEKREKLQKLRKNQKKNNSK
ncbi:hypothetical protein TKK_0009637 [Trichogramma kaykai]|uniref:Poly A polymerase head domain-containing protein n=1 Tax=Trichogramma kaykai TaxID=54128 RepID=A0ABD2X1H5_9HYME